MKVLITGINGFAGSHLAEFLLAVDGVQVAGLDLRHAEERESVPVYCCDLGDADAVNAAVAREQPDAVIHLAARAQVAGAWESAAVIMETNVVRTQTLMQAIHRQAPGARVLLISSSEIYGKAAPGDLPLTESSPLKPANPYSVSKTALEFVGLQYFEAFGMEVVIARPFNHIGPGQMGNFVVPAFARQIAEMEAGLAEPVLRVGNLEPARDFTDVRDIVRAYYLIVTGGTPGERYNVASGRSHTIREVLDLLLEQARVKPRIEQAPELMRPADIPMVVGDAARLRSLGPWEPTVPMSQSLTDALVFWRQRVAAPGYVAGG